MDESPERCVKEIDETDTKIREQKWIMVGIKRIVKKESKDKLLT